MKIKMQIMNKLRAVWQNKRFVMVVVLFLTLSGVALGSKSPLIASLLGKNRSPQLTIIARADGTFDIKEFAKQGQWFGPEVVGEGLKITAIRRYGQGVKMGNINILVQADPGVKDETIRAALVSVGQSGFTRIGFTDPHLGEIAMRVASSPIPTPVASVKTGKVVAGRQ